VKIIQVSGVRLIQSSLLAAAGCVHAFGTVDLGSRPGPTRQKIMELFPAIHEAATIRQVHGRRAVAVRGGGDVAGLRRTQADIMVTEARGIALAARTADCAPILILDPRRRVAAAVHAGWRGTAARVAAAAVEALAEHYGSRPADLLAAIGPCIQPCHYQVDEPVIAAMKDALGSRADLVLAPDGPGKARLDLSLANRIVLESAGALPGRLEAAKWCTYDEAGLFFSYRRQGQGVPSLYHFIALV